MPVDLDELEALEREATKAPWRYRARENDDWGFVRAGNNLIARARAGYYISPDDEWRHRREGTDPYAHNAAFIAAFRNAAPSLFAEIREARKRIAEFERMQTIDLYEFAEAVRAYEELAAATERPVDDAQPGRRRVAHFTIERSGDVYYADILNGSAGLVAGPHLKMYETPGKALIAAVDRARGAIKQRETP